MSLSCRDCSFIDSLNLSHNAGRYYCNCRDSKYYEKDVGDIKIEKCENFMGIFKIPVEWSMYAVVEIEASSVEDAIERFYKSEDEMPLPTDADYIDGSLRIACDKDDEVEYTKLINGLESC